MKRRCRAIAVVGVGLALSACNDVQSTLVPAGPAAADIAGLSWILFAGGGAILLLVVIACWIAVRGSPAARAPLSGVGTVVVAGIAFPVLTLTALLGYGVWLTRASVPIPDQAAALRVEVVGEQWWWRVLYQAPDGQTIASANEIHIPAGERIHFVLTSPDVIHSFWVPRLGGKVDMIPGRTTHLYLQASAPGVFRGQCAEYCGGPHALMALEVVALPGDAFATWLANESKPAAVPETAKAEQGRALFSAAGCGGCHAVRGTEATGIVGPDLTHIGSRRSVGIDTARLSPENLARFIADGQHMKPGNRMPPFRIFTPTELDALATYLAGLR